MFKPTLLHECARSAVKTLLMGTVGGTLGTVGQPVIWFEQAYYLLLHEWPLGYNSTVELFQQECVMALGPLKKGFLTGALSFSNHHKKSVSTAMTQEQGVLVFLLLTLSTANNPWFIFLRILDALWNFPWGKLFFVTTSHCLKPLNQIRREM